MADNSYWSKRLKQEMLAKQASEADVDKAMSALYRVHQTNIEKEIQAFYQKYADDEGVSISEAKKRADKVDVQAFADKAKRYVEEKDFSPRANAELKLYNLKMRVSRAELLQYNMDLELLALGEGERQLTEKFLKAGFADEVKSQSGILGEYIKNPKTVERSMEAVLNVPFEGVTWSERIWERQQALRQVVARTAHETLVRGRNAMAMIPELRREFGVSKSSAKRLAVTEVARVQSEAQKISMIENGFDEYEYIAEPTACPICAKLDGNIYKVSEMEPGKNCAPMHPHCHCSTAPHMDRGKTWDKIDRVLNDEEPNLNKGFNTYDDPIREVMGSAFESHPKETLEKIEELQKMGVDVIFHSGEGMMYQPGALGKPGQVKVDREASYSALLHEYVHAVDDEASGWQAARMVWDNDKAIEFEKRAYDAELEFYRLNNVPDEYIIRLEKLKKKEYERIRNRW
jgi:SPP1 gp7 family putative phage head morphogenesis protein